ADCKTVLERSRRAHRILAWLKSPYQRSCGTNGCRPLLDSRPLRRNFRRGRALRSREKSPSDGARRPLWNMDSFGTLYGIPATLAEDLSKTSALSRKHRCHQLGNEKSISAEIRSEMFRALSSYRGVADAECRTGSQPA